MHINCNYYKKLYCLVLKYVEVDLQTTENIILKTLNRLLM